MYHATLWLFSPRRTSGIKRSKQITQSSFKARGLYALLSKDHIMETSYNFDFDVDELLNMDNFFSNTSTGSNDFPSPALLSGVGVGISPRNSPLATPTSIVVSPTGEPSSFHPLRSSSPRRSRSRSRSRSRGNVSAARPRVAPMKQPRQRPIRSFSNDSQDVSYSSNEDGNNSNAM